MVLPAFLKAPFSLLLPKTARIPEPPATFSSDHENLPPMGLSSPQKEYDIVEAETEFRINEFDYYGGIVIRDTGPYFRFYVHFEQGPPGQHMVLCPPSIHAPNLSSPDRDIFQLKLHKARRLVQDRHWDIVQMDAKDGLLLVKEEGSSVRHHMPTDISQSQ